MKIPKTQNIIRMSEKLFRILLKDMSVLSVSVSVQHTMFVSNVISTRFQEKEVKIKISYKYMRTKTKKVINPWHQSSTEDINNSFIYKRYFVFTFRKTSFYILFSRKHIFFITFSFFLFIMEYVFFSEISLQIKVYFFFWFFKRKNIEFFPHMIVWCSMLILLPLLLALYFGIELIK